MTMCCTNSSLLTYSQISISENRPLILTHYEQHSHWLCADFCLACWSLPCQWTTAQSQISAHHHKQISDHLLLRSFLRWPVSANLATQKPATQRIVVLRASVWQDWHLRATIHFPAYYLLITEITQCWMGPAAAAAAGSTTAIGINATATQTTVKVVAWWAHTAIVRNVLSNKCTSSLKM